MNDLKACLYAGKNNLAVTHRLAMQHKKRFSSHNRQEGMESGTGGRAEPRLLQGHIHFNRGIWLLKQVGTCDFERYYLFFFFF